MSSTEVNVGSDDQIIMLMNKRHRSAKSNFKNPPQPRFCIKEKTLDGRDLYINVLSYSRIASQLSEFDPIPLYGGMEVRSYSSINKHSAAPHITKQPPTPQLIFAVMASPEVLKKTGRNCADTPEQMNLVELMCEFIEAMNPGVILSKKPEILRDRDLAGELKDVWSAVQNFRDKEKAGISDIVVYTEFGPDSAPESMVKSFHRNESNNGKPVKSEINDASNVDQFSESQHLSEKDEGENTIEKEKEVNKDNMLPEKNIDESDTPDIKIEKLSLGGDKKTEPKSIEINHNMESSEKIKMQNQKNKESHFFPKFLSSSKEKEVKDEEPKKKTKSLNFFRRNKSTASSPTHTNNTSSNQKSDSNSEQ